MFDLLLRIPGQTTGGAAAAAWLDLPTGLLLAGMIALLALANAVVWLLRRQAGQLVDRALLSAFNSRVFAWWMLTAGLAIGLLTDALLERLGGFSCATVIAFGLLSFWALREYITMTPTRRGDHRTLFWTFFCFTPLQFTLVGLGRGYQEAYSILIPVYGSLFIPTRVALSGDPKRFLDRSAKILAGLLICVYSLSFAPAVLDLRLLTWNGAAGQLQPWTGSNAGLLLYLVLVAQLGDAMQYIWDKLLGRRVIAPEINSSKTWEGFIGGALSTTALGALLWWVTPFTIWGAAAMSLVIAITGSAGGLTLSAIKRDRGVPDYGTLVQGHAGVLDRLDSICFAAPVFFHATHYLLGAPG